MSPADERVPGRPGQLAPVEYEPPQVEQVLTPADLECEILYAGDNSVDT
jgi:hypothetical protein